MTQDYADRLRDEALAEGLEIVRGVRLIKRQEENTMAVIIPNKAGKADLRNFEMIGADYERFHDFYLDRDTGRLYVDYCDGGVADLIFDPESEEGGSMIRAVRLRRNDGQEFYTESAVDLYNTGCREDVVVVDVVELSAEDRRRIPATVESCEFFSTSTDEEE